MGPGKEEGLTPEEWDRGGWIAVCEDHFGDFYDEDRDAYGDVMDVMICDMKGCGKLAEYEVFGNLSKELKEAQAELKIENPDGYDIIMTDTFIDGLREMEENEDEEDV